MISCTILIILKQLHFIGISEAWATDSNKNLLSIPGYSHEQCICSNQKRGGGTSLYIRNQIQYKTRDDLAFPLKIYKSIFIEVDITIFNTNRKHNHWCSL